MSNSVSDSRSGPCQNSYSTDSASRAPLSTLSMIQSAMHVLNLWQLGFSVLRPGSRGKFRKAPLFIVIQYPYPSCVSCDQLVSSFSFPSVLLPRSVARNLLKSFETTSGHLGFVRLFWQQYSDRSATIRKTSFGFFFSLSAKRDRTTINLQQTTQICIPPAYVICITTGHLYVHVPGPDGGTSYSEGDVQSHTNTCLLSCVRDAPSFNAAFTVCNDPRRTTGPTTGAICIGPTADPW